MKVTLIQRRGLFIPFWVHLVSNLRSGARAKAERTQSEGRVGALCENESEIGHFPIVFECKDSTELRHGKLFRAKKVTFPTFKKKRLSLVSKEALFSHRGIAWTGNKKTFLGCQWRDKTIFSRLTNKVSAQKRVSKILSII